MAELEQIDLRQRIETVRIERRLNRTTMAKVLRVCYGTYFNWMNGKPSPRVETRVRGYLGIPEPVIAPPTPLNDDEALPRTAFDHLSPRVREVVRLTSRGFTNREIAARLFITENTVKNHMTAAYEALEKQGIKLTHYYKRSKVAYLMGLADGIASERRAQSNIVEFRKAS